VTTFWTYCARKQRKQEGRQKQATTGSDYAHFRYNDPLRQSAARTAWHRHTCSERASKHGQPSAAAATHGANKPRARDTRLTKRRHVTAAHHIRHCQLLLQPGHGDGTQQSNQLSFRQAVHALYRAISSWYSRIFASFGSSLILGLFLMFLARSANLRQHTMQQLWSM
jgi:hypothetical protein